jgi:hypothetical protein
MTLEYWKSITDVVNNVVVTLAALAAGLWALFRLWRERTDEAALDMSVSQQTAPFGKDCLVTLTVELTNRGKTKVQAKTERTASGFAFDDSVEKLSHAFSIQIKRFKDSSPIHDRRLDWFEGGPVEPVGGLSSEINLLTDYQDPENNNVVDFWLEPGETYRLGVPLVLSAGLYLGKATFIAAGGDQNFWTQVFSFAVPPLGGGATSRNSQTQSP